MYMIYDCFSFYNELDLLEIRLNVLKDVVDKFVLAEAPVTHTGHPKPLYFNENKDRFAGFLDRIVHIVVDDFPEPPADYTLRQASWMRENWQRNALARGLCNAKPDDMILISDMDEIPSPEAVKETLSRKGVIQFNQYFSNFYLNYLNYVRPLWPGTKALRYKDYCAPSIYIGMPPVEYLDETVNRPPSLSRVRYLKGTSSINKSGWHFSYLGGEEAFLQKARSIAHVEYVNDETDSLEFVRRMVSEGVDVTGCGYRFFPVPLDGRFPKYLRDNAARYANLILPVGASEIRRTRFKRLRFWLRGWFRRAGAKLLPRAIKPFLFKVYCKVVRDPIKI